MAEQSTITVAVKADTSSVARTARIIARHLTAMADELEQPDYLVKFPEPLTADQVAEFKARFRSHFEQEGTPDGTCPGA
jgi:transcription initiation factor TFIIIB Brf1 subunit/transcription initiation factor TFIIB